MDSAQGINYSRNSGRASDRFKSLAHKFAASSGIARLFRFRLRRRLLVVVYHGVCAERADVNDPAGMHVPARLFEAQVHALLDHYQPVSLARVIEHFAAGRPLPDNAVLITFDDGYRNTLFNGLPILRSLKVPCAIFPIVSAVETGEWPWFVRVAYHSRLDTRAFLGLCSGLMQLSAAQRHDWLVRHEFATNGPENCDHTICGWDELAAALEGGSIELGSHSMNHLALDNCGPSELMDELVQARVLLNQRLNVNAEAIAYPFGRCSLKVCSTAAAVGYKLGFQAEERHASPNDQIMAIPRIAAGPGDTPIALLSRMSGWMETFGV